MLLIITNNSCHTNTVMNFFAINSSTGDPVFSTYRLKHPLHFTSHAFLIIKCNHFHNTSHYFLPVENETDLIFMTLFLFFYVFFKFLWSFKLALQAVLYSRLIPGAPFNEYQACGLSIHFTCPWAGISRPFRPEMHYRDVAKSMFAILKTSRI